MGRGRTLLRHSDVKLTLQFYTHAVSRDRMVAAGKMLTAILSHAPNKNGLRADWNTMTRVTQVL
jgi:RNA:NAD 2'-phosphotransferase (TPT1/KptA family)